jgi:hypothetical protein
MQKTAAAVLAGVAAAFALGSIPAWAQNAEPPAVQPGPPPGFLLSLNTEQLQAVVADLELPYEARREADGSTTLVIEFPTAEASLYQYIDNRRLVGLRLSAGYATRTKPTAEVVNAFNRRNRFTKVFLDDDKDPFLVMDLDVGSGLTRSALMEFFEEYERSIAVFESTVLNRRPAPAGQ